MAIELKTQRNSHAGRSLSGIILSSSQPNDMVQKIDISLLDEIENQPFKINPKRWKIMQPVLRNVVYWNPIQVRC